MEPDCRKITKEILPAIRASIAETMDRQYHYRQSDIAERLGLVQVAVSKYLNGKYSPRVAEIKAYIMEHGLVNGVVHEIAKGGTRDEIDRQITALCGKISNAL